MIRSSLDSRDVLIGGAGIAAAAAALRLRSLGFRPLLLAITRPIIPGAEAIPETALALFAELEIQGLIAKDSVLIDGFENHWNEREPVLRSGRWIHVERASLAKAVLQEAVRRGSRLQICKSLPKLSVNAESVSVEVEGKCLHFQAAIDATGRSAVWSRPIQRHGNQVADIFSVETESTLRSRVLRRPDGWAYRIGLKDSATVALVTENGIRRNKPDAQIQKALAIEANHLNFIGRRPAFAQWSVNPVQFRRVAVGDAALAYNPIAGQGICFALSSAVAASAVIKTWHDSPGESIRAERFYSDFVAQRRRRHLESLNDLHSGDLLQEDNAEPLPDEVVFSGRTVRTCLQINSQIVEDEAVLFSDGTAVRWVGGLDILRIRDLASRPISSFSLIKSLSSLDLRPSQVIAVLHWCVQHNLLCGSVRDR
jgi:flavin-dependent dehydrogenase